MTAELLRLRPYQTECLEAVAKAHGSGMDRPAVVLPTGTGKTVIFSHLAQRNVGGGRGRVLILVHRDELADQAMDKIRSLAPHLSVGKVKAKDDETGADVVVASVQTVSRANRLAALVGSQNLAAPFGLVIHDEAHHSVAESWRRISAAFPDARHVGFTATLARGDGVGLGSVWSEVVYTRSPLWMISRGYLVDVKGRTVSLDGLDLDAVKKTGGDYAAGALGSALIDADGPELIAKAVRTYALGRRTIVFTPDVASAHATADALDGAAVVTGATPRDERVRIYEAFRTGAASVLVSCMVLTEGFDAPWADCAVIARPTRSPSLYIQMVGRVLRPWPGKGDALVLNVCGASGHLSTLIDLEPGAVPDIKDGETLGEAAVREEERLNETASAGSFAFALKNKDVDLFSSSSQSWLRTGAGVMFIPAEAGEVFLWPEDGGTWTVAHAPKGEKWRRLHTGLTLGTAMAWAETEADELSGFSVRRSASWKKTKASAPQLAFAATLGLDVPEKARKGEIGDMISTALASRKIDRYVGKR